MKYSVGECLADYGFAFFEKIHEPIFLVHRLGRVTRMNEAARKLLSVARIGRADLEGIFSIHFNALFLPKQGGYGRFKLGRKQLIARSFGNSDYILVEVRR